MGPKQLIKSQSGQILLVSILVAVIALTVGLSVATRSLTNTKISTDETDSQKALSAAEAGVEQLAKKTDTTTSSPFTQSLGSASFTASAVGVAGLEILVNGGGMVTSNDGADIWLSDYPSYLNPQNFNNLTIFWNDKANDNCTAIEVVVISGADKNNPDMNRYAYDNCATAHGNSFNSTDINTTPRKIQNQLFNRNVKLPIITAGRILRVIPIYNSSAIGAVSVGTQFPSQGLVIESQGTAGNVTRKVRVYKSYPKVPTEFFPYSLFQP